MLEKEYDPSILEESENICKDCLNYKDFKERCWYFWELKKECSQKLKK